MSKIICDVCGTAYPETAAQCPICGCAKPDDAQVSNSDSSKAGKKGSSSYTYVKGGRFSKANVRKRNKANQPAHNSRQTPRQAEEKDNSGKSNRGLVITIIVLLLAILAIIFYLAVRYFLPGKNPSQNKNPIAGTTTAPTISTTNAPSYPCTDLKTSNSVVELEKADAAYLLNIIPVPENTTDTITFESNDESVATVSSEGCVTAVAPGQAIITITCGDITKQCRIVCTFTLESTEPPTEAPTEETTAPTVSNEPFELNRSDITMSYKGEEWQLYNGSISKLSITWTSDDPSVATIEGGLVTAVGPGMTEVHGEYNGQIVTCIIRCSFSD